MSEVSICNAALGYLGDSGTVSSIDPPEGSAQASRCAQFYPMARDAILEMHSWGFATRRVALAQVADPTSAWQYAYAAPAGVLNYLEILDPQAQDEYTTGIQVPYTAVGYSQTSLAVYIPQPFEVEADDNGNDLILTNQQNAVLRYTGVVTDTTKFSPLFIMALARLLASMLAGPILKGDAGRKESENQLNIFAKFMEKAVESDANQRKEKLVPGAPWMVNR